MYIREISLDYLSNWLVLLDNVHDVVWEPGHVFADDETQMATIDDLVMENSTADLFHCPLAISWCSHNIIRADKDSNGDLWNWVKRNFLSNTLIHERIELVEFGSPFLEAVHFDILSKEEERSNGRTRWIVISIDEVAVLVVP